MNFEAIISYPANEINMNLFEKHRKGRFKHMLKEITYLFF